MTGIATQERSKLASIGINIKRDNTLEVNKGRFKSALTYNSGKVQDIIGGQNGFASKIEAKTKEVPQVNTNADINQYLNQFNPYNSHLGSLFDYFA